MFYSSTDTIAKGIQLSCKKCRNKNISHAPSHTSNEIWTFILDRFKLIT